MSYTVNNNLNQPLQILLGGGKVIELLPYESKDLDFTEEELKTPFVENALTSGFLHLTKKEDKKTKQEIVNEENVDNAQTLDKRKK